MKIKLWKRRGGGEAASLGVVKRFLKNNPENGISLAFMCVFLSLCVCVCVLILNCVQQCWSFFGNPEPGTEKSRKSRKSRSRSFATVLTVSTVRSRLVYKGPNVSFVTDAAVALL